MNSNKVILSLYIPVEGKTIEMRVPKQMKVAQVIKLLCDLLARQRGEYIATDSTLLCERQTGKILEANAFINDIDLQNGSELMIL